jgi:hypothetical protein
MSFKRPFKAVPIRPVGRYRHSSLKSEASIHFRLIGGGFAFGSLLGITILVWPTRSEVPDTSSIQSLAAETGLIRARAPQTGDYWPNCDMAKAAGTFPIYAGEPGYRGPLDYDADGLACEPYPD